MRLAALLLLVVCWPAHGQTLTHVYACPTTPTSIVGAPSSACPTDDYYLVAALMPNWSVAACAPGTCSWSSASLQWRLVSTITATQELWMCPQASESNCRFSTLVAAPPPPPPPVLGSALLSWSLPTMNVDGSVLSDLAGVRVYQGSNVTASLGAVTSYNVTGLVDGTYTWTARAFDTAGNESVDSNAASKTIGGTPPPPTPTTPVVVATSTAPYSVAFGLTSTGTRSSTTLGLVPVGVSCSGVAVGTYRGAAYYRVARVAVAWFAGVTQTDSVVAPCR